MVRVDLRGLFSWLALNAAAYLGLWLVYLAILWSNRRGTYTAGRYAGGRWVEGFMTYDPGPSVWPVEPVPWILLVLAAANLLALGLWLMSKTGKPHA
jgi:hypothetical protein